MHVYSLCRWQQKSQSAVAVYPWDARMSDGRGNIQRPTLRSAVFLVRFLCRPIFRYPTLPEPQIPKRQPRPGVRAGSIVSTVLEQLVSSTMSAARDLIGVAFFPDLVVVPYTHGVSSFTRRQ